MNEVVRLGTRGSALARWQTEYVRKLLETAHPGLRAEVHIITTHGDKVLDTPLPLIGGKGVFTAELEAALRSGEIDVAVHSLKDLPIESPPGLTVGAIPPRVNSADALVSQRGYRLETLPHGAVVGTSSRRRAAQLLYKRPDLHLLDIRGNVDTRVRKAFDPNQPYDAILLAVAGLMRLDHADVITEILSFDDMLPAPGQGALGVQCRDDSVSQALLAPINHPPTAHAVTAERAFLGGMGGGCSLPIAAYATVEHDHLVLRGRVNAPDGSQQVDVEIEGSAPAAPELGAELVQMALGEGAAAILAGLA